MKKILLAVSSIVFLTMGNVLAEEIRQSIGTEAFASQEAGQNYEVFKFDLPQIPEGSRIDFAGLVFHIQRDSVRNDYLSLKLVPISSDWSAASVRNGQLLSMNDTLPAFAVADVNREDKVEMDITQLVAAWHKGEKTNYGFYLASESSDDETKLSVKSVSGAKMELVIYYTAPEKK
jgi:hypothetical protein